jgi:hypothetical protein
VAVKAVGAVRGPEPGGKLEEGESGAFRDGKGIEA